MTVTSEPKEPDMDNIFSTSGHRVDAPRERGRHPRVAVSVKMHALLFASLFLLMAKAMTIKGVFFALLGAVVVQVHYKCVGDGDGFSAYVDTAIPREYANVPLEVHEMVMERTQARTARDYQKADALLRSLDEAGYKMIKISGKEILAKKYRIRMRGVDAPELKMANGEESKNALMDLIGEKRVTIYVYGQDQFGRYVGDIYCDNVFIQEEMLKSGHVWHFKNYDKRPEFAQWEREARAARRGIFASEKPEKPWHWRRDQRSANIPVY